MYQFAKDQLHKLLVETIGLYEEYVHAHEFTVDSAASQSVLDIIEGLDEERGLILQGEQFTSSQTFDKV